MKHSITLQQGDHVNAWRLGERFGEGGQGVCFYVKGPDSEESDPDIKRKLKVFENDESFHREQLPQSLKSPQIPVIYDAAETGQGNPYIVSEYIEGKTLAHWKGLHPISEIQPPFEDAVQVDRAFNTWFVVLELFEKLLVVMTYLHDNGCSHRDIKPDNVIVTSNDLPCLIDFGQSAFVAASRESSNGRESGNRFLRLPEQAPGTKHLPYKKGTDTAYLTGILFYLLTGAAPRMFKDAHGVLTQEKLKPLTATLCPPASKCLRNIFEYGFHENVDQRITISGLRFYIESLRNELQKQCEELKTKCTDFESLFEDCRKTFGGKKNHLSPRNVQGVFNQVHPDGLRARSQLLAAIKEICDVVACGSKEIGGCLVKWDPKVKKLSAEPK